MKRILTTCIALLAFAVTSFGASAEVKQTSYATGEMIISQDFNWSYQNANVEGSTCPGWGRFNNDDTNKLAQFRQCADRTGNGYGIYIYDNVGAPYIQMNYDGYNGTRILKTQCYRITFWAKKLSGTPYFFVNDKNRSYDDDYSVAIDSGEWKKYTFTMGPTGMDDLVDFAYPIGSSGEYQLQFSASGDSDTAEFYVDDFSIQQLSFISHNFNWATSNGQIVDEGTSNNWSGYHADETDRYAHLERVADRDGGGYGVHVFNKNNMEYIQFNHKCWSEKEPLSLFQSYKITFWVKMLQGNAEFIVMDTGDYGPDYYHFDFLNAEQTQTADGWVKYSFLMGPENTSDLIDFEYPSDHSEGFQFRFQPKGSATETMEFYVDDFTVQKVGFEESNFEAGKGTAEYSNSAKIGTTLVNGNTFVATASISNRTSSERAATVIVARYDKENNKLMDAAIGTKALFDGGETGTAEARMILPENEDLTKQKVKIFVLDSASNLIPLAQVSTYPNREEKITTVAEVDLNYMIDSKYIGDFYVEPMHELGFPYVFYPW